MEIIITIIKVIFLLGFLIFMHEGGHFIVAKICKVRVNEFSIGFGPKIWGKNGKETKYTLRLIPLGGFVNMEGEEKPSWERGSFSEAKVWKKIAIVFAGGFVNIVFGLAVYYIIAITNGNFYNNTVDYTIENYGADLAGILPGDEILEINGNSVKSREEIVILLSKQNTRLIDVKINRNGDILDFKVELIEENSRYYLGIVFKQIEPNFSEQLYYATLNTKEFVLALVDNVKMIFTGNVSVDQMVGPVGISEQVAKTDTFIEFFYLMAIISLSLGVTNLLPFPPLDGGKIVMILVEIIARRKISEKVQVSIQLFGLALLMSLSLYVTFNDVIRILK